MSKKWARQRLRGTRPPGQVPPGPLPKRKGEAAMTLAAHLRRPYRGVLPWLIPSAAATLLGTGLIYAKVQPPTLRGAVLVGVVLIGADLRGADLEGAWLSRADL